MKVLFLDVDGVLNSAQTRGGMFTVDEAACKLLDHVLKVTGAKIVLSSTWRYAYTEEKFNAFLEKHGVEPSVISMTSREKGEWGTGRCRPRGYVILDWLKEHPEITNYAVIDDTYEAELGIQKGRFVHTNYKYGMRKQDADKLIAILGE